jgi:N-acyl-D-aspartate/D-glutamate deacylase
VSDLPHGGPARRAFLAASAAAASLAAVSRGALAAPAIRRFPAHDLVIRGGLVLDGRGGPGRVADVAISAGRVAEIAPRVVGQGEEELDARGLVVAPGFVDIHSHAEGNLADDPRLESVVRQGITTVVVGADGSSSFTGAADRGFAAWATQVEGHRPAVNVAAMVGLGSVRGAVVGAANRPATASELARMVAMVERALAEGACGASTGLEYAPGAFATLDELIALARPLAARRLPYASHLRNEDDRLLESIDEALAVGRGAGCPVQLSHLKQQGRRNWDKLDASLARLAAAREAGVEAWFDVYPYEAYSTGLSNLFPIAALDGGTEAFLARLADSAEAPALRRQVLAKVELLGSWDQVQIASVRAAEDRAAEGKRLGAYAASLGADPYDTAVGLLRRSGGSVGMLGFGMSEANIDRLLAHPWGMVCSDGGAFAVEGPTRRGSPHPRGAGTFPRVLGRFVRERKALTLEEAIPRMTSVPAARVGLADRGVLAPGMAGDVVVFDPATVADSATFANPFQYPVGITAVVVSGFIALQGAQRSSGGTGRVLRPGAR